MDSRRTSTACTLSLFARFVHQKAPCLDLQPLPYPLDHLEPAIPHTIVQLHHDGHHQAYSDNAKRLLATVDLSQKDPLGLRNISALFFS